MLELVIKDLVRAMVVAAIGAAVTHLLSRDRHGNVTGSSGGK